MAPTPMGASEDTFAKLMRGHAQVRPDRPAIRHKDLGIWRTWTWAEAYVQVRALAQGLRLLGLEEGERIAVVGANRPRLYWTITAAQALGAIPVPVYADSVADELAAVLGLADVVMAVAQDQEQVDKLLSIAKRLPRLAHILYDEERGLSDYDDPRLRPIAAVIAAGEEALADVKTAAALDATIENGKGCATVDHPVHVGHDRPLERRGAVGRALRRGRSRHSRLRPSDRPRRSPRLSAARLGRRSLSQLCAGHGRRLLHGLSGK